MPARRTLLSLASLTKFSTDIISFGRASLMLIELSKLSQPSVGQSPHPTFARFIILVEFRARVAKHHARSYPSRRMISRKIYIVYLSITAQELPDLIYS
jgi:hypothetical protein